MNNAELINDLQLVPLHPWWNGLLFWVYWVLAILVVAIGLTRLLGRRQPFRGAPSIALPEPDWEAEFLLRLNDLRKIRPTLSPYSLAISATALVKEYLAASRKWMAPWQTSQELMQWADSRPGLSGQQVQCLDPFLRLADRIKFARFTANSDEMDQLLDNAEQVIRDSKNLQSKMPSSATQSLP